MTLASASMPIVSDEERARFEVLLEQIRDQVGAVAEGHGALNTRLDTLSTDVRANNARLDTLSGDVRAFRREVDDRFREVGDRFSGVETRLDRVETRLDGVETRLDRVETRLDGVETRLDGVEAHLKNGHPAPAPKRRSSKRKAKKK